MEGDASAGSNSGKNTATPSRPLGLSNLSDLASVVTASGSDNMLVGRGTHSGISVWGTSPTSMSREVSPNSSSQSASSKAAVNKAWADSVPQSLHRASLVNRHLQQECHHPQNPAQQFRLELSTAAIPTPALLRRRCNSLLCVLQMVSLSRLHLYQGRAAATGVVVLGKGTMCPMVVQQRHLGHSPPQVAPTQERRSLFQGVGVLRLLALAMLMLPLARGKSPT